MHWYWHLLTSKDGNILRRETECQTEGEWKKGRLKRTCNMTWKKCFSRHHAFVIKVDLSCKSDCQ